MTLALRTLSIFGLVTILAIVPLVARVPNPNASIFLDQLHNSGHTVLFFVFHLLILLAIHRGLKRYFRTSRAGVVLVVGSALSFTTGLAIEWVQPAIGRDSSWGDVYRNCLGIIAANGAFFTLLPNMTHLAVRVAGAVIATAALIAGFAPAASWAYAQMLRDQTFPVLIDFDNDHVNRYVSEAAGGTLTLVPAPAQWPNNASAVAKVHMPKKLRYPGMLLRNPKPNWQGYSTLSFDAYSPNNEPELLAINFHSAEKGRRPLMHRRFTLLPGLHEYQLDLTSSEILAEHHITSLLLHALDSERSKTLYIDNLRLQ